MFDDVLSQVIAWAITGLAGLTLAWTASRYRLLKKKQADTALQEESLGIIKVFKTRQDAVGDQFDALAEAESIGFLSFNGAALLDTAAYLDSSLVKILRKWQKNSSKQIRVLLLDPSRSDVILARYRRIDARGGASSHTETSLDTSDIGRALLTFTKISQKFPFVQLQSGFFSGDLLWCLLLFDDRVICSFYQKGVTAASARTLLIRRSSALGQALEFYFEDHWSHRKVADVADPQGAERIEQ